MKNNEEYVSLYDYLGTSPKDYGVSKRVAEMAIERNIPIKYKVLPEHLQTERYKSVIIYPISFLDEYFQNSDIVLDRTPFVRRSVVLKLEARIMKLEQKLKELQEKFTVSTPTYINPDNSWSHSNDDLPF